MQPRTKAALFDIAHAALGISQFVEGKTLENYKSDLMLRSAVERQLSIIGEAVAKLRKFDSTTASRISEHERIISFRNVLIHGYDRIDDEAAWKIVQEKLPTLLQEVEAMLKS
jgi:uncharacterized protein with HEPN domain